VGIATPEVIRQVFRERHLLFEREQSVRVDADDERLCCNTSEDVLE
jgi:hypothetical protein